MGDPVQESMRNIERWRREDEQANVATDPQPTERKFKKPGLSRMKTFMESVEVMLSVIIVTLASLLAFTWCMIFPVIGLLYVCGYLS